MENFFGTRVRKLRESRGLTQEQLASYLGIKRPHVCSLELGTRGPSLEVLRDIADFFGVSTDYLLGRDISYLEQYQQEITELRKRLMELEEKIRP